ncbi:MAG: hypothetical protein U1F81_03355 [Verrucomicrobiaceae bacterium]
MPAQIDSKTHETMASILKEYREACNAWRKAEDEIGDSIRRLNYYWRVIAEFEELKRLQSFVLDEVFYRLPPAKGGGEKVNRVIRRYHALWSKRYSGTITTGELFKAYPGIWRFHPPSETVELPDGQLVMRNEPAGRIMANILLRIIREKPDKKGRAKLKPEFARLWTEEPGFAKRWSEVHPPDKAGRPVNEAVAGVADKAYKLATNRSWCLLNGMEEMEGPAIRFLRWPCDEASPFATVPVSTDELARCRRLVRFIAKFVSPPSTEPDIPMLDAKYWKAQIEHFEEFWRIVLEPTFKAHWNAAQRLLNRGKGDFSEDVMKRFGYEWADYCSTRTVRSRRKWSDKIRDTMKRHIREYLLTSTF